MKTLYSSTFMSAILGFLLLVGQSEQGVVLTSNDQRSDFKTIMSHPEQTLDKSKVVIEVFTSFGCPECNAFGRGTLLELNEKYGESQKNGAEGVEEVEKNESKAELKVYFTPDKENPGEFYGVKGAHCAAEHGRFWDMVRNLYITPNIDQREVDLIGQEMGLPVIEFRECLKGDLITEIIDQNIEYKREREIEKRPSTTVGGTLLIGDQPIENIEREIQRSLKKL